MAHVPVPDRASLVRTITELLQRDATVECELGTFYTTELAAYMGRNPRTGEFIPIPPKRIPHFVPSDALIGALGGATAAGRSHYLGELAREAKEIAELEGDLDDDFDDDDDDDDASDDDAPPIVPPTTDTIVLGPVFDEIARMLGSKRTLAVSGLGRFRRYTVRRGEHRGRAAVALVFSPVLKLALNPDRRVERAPQ